MVLYYHMTSIVTCSGPASAPMLDIQSVGPTVVIINMSVPATGGLCVDLYRASVVVGGMTLSGVQSVTSPSQDVYTFELLADLCRDVRVTSATAVGVTDGVIGTMATLNTSETADRSSKMSN